MISATATSTTVIPAVRARLLAHTALLAACLSLSVAPAFAADGDLDTSFDGDGKVSIQLGSNWENWTEDLIVLLDGSVLLAGPAQVGTTDHDFSVIKLKSDGSLDTQFGVNGVATAFFDLGGDRTDHATAIAQQSDGKLVVGGIAETAQAESYDFAVTRFTANGSPDMTFGNNTSKVTYSFSLGGTDRMDMLTDLVIQPDGKIVLVGWSDWGGGDHDFVAVRLHSDGSLDTTFGALGQAIVPFDQGGLDSDKARTVVLQNDGKIILVGSAQLNNGDYDFAVARLLPTGAPDTSYGSNGRRMVPFDRGGTKQDLAEAAMLDNAGRLVVAGQSEGATHALMDFAVARLLTTGDLDTSFGTQGKVTVGIDAGDGWDQATGVSAAPSDQLIVSGRAHVTSLDVDFAAVRLNSNGTLDTGFGISGKSRVSFNLGGSLRDLPYAMTVGLDGGIVMAGTVVNAQGLFISGVAKLEGAPWFWTWP